MKPGIQISSFRPLMKTEAQLHSVLSHVAAMGCDLVQLQWIDPSIAPEIIARELAAFHIQSVSVQDLFTHVRTNPHYYLRLNHLTGGTWLCVSRIPEELKSKTELYKYASELHQLESLCAQWGQKLCFHPVSVDFSRPEGGDPVEQLLEMMPQLMVCADLYHLNKCGKAIGSWLLDHAGRVCMVHFKDSRITPDGEEILVSPGQGDIDWTDIPEICEKTGISYVFAEQERWQAGSARCPGTYAQMCMVFASCFY